jgi:hypothetical protein
MFWTNNRVRYVGAGRDGLAPGMLGRVVIGNTAASEDEILVHYDARPDVNEYHNADELEFVAKGSCGCNGCTYDGEHRW